MALRIVIKDKSMNSSEPKEKQQVILDEEENTLQYSSEKQCESEGGEFCYFYDKKKPSKSKTIPTKTVGKD
jgi:archaellum component FlaD/FlaE